MNKSAGESNVSDYPMWIHVRRGLWVSAEQDGGIPDFVIVREPVRGSPRDWLLRWRLGDVRERFLSAADAKAYVHTDTATPVEHRGRPSGATVRTLGRTP